MGIRCVRRFAAAAVLLLGGCFGGGDDGDRVLVGAGTPQSTRTQVLRFAMGREPGSLDPAAPDGKETHQVTAHVCEGLLEFIQPLGDPGLLLAVRGAIANEWEVDRDGRTIVFRLIEGLRFHDGTAVDSEAMAFSLSRALEPDRIARVAGEFPEAAEAADTVAAIEPLGPHVLMIRLKRPSGTLLKALAHPYFAAVSPSSVRSGSPGVERHPVGSGPYRLEEWTPGERIVLAENEEYASRYNDVQGFLTIPNSARIEFRVVEDSSGRLAALTGGEVHLTEELSFADAKALDEGGEACLRRSPGCSTTCLVFCCRRPPFDRAEVRRAVSLAIDRKRIAHDLFGGYARPAAGMLSPIVWGYFSSPEPLLRDLSAAARLLDSTDSTAISLRIVAATGDDPVAALHGDVARAVSEDLSALGFETTVAESGTEEALRQLRDGGADAVVLTWATRTGDASSLLRPFTSAFDSAFGWEIPEVEDGVAAADRAVGVEGSAELRQQAFMGAERAVRERTPWVFLVHPEALGACHCDLGSYRPHPLGIAQLGAAALR